MHAETIVFLRIALKGPGAEHTGLLEAGIPGCFSSFPVVLQTKLLVYHGTIFWDLCMRAFLLKILN